MAQRRLRLLSSPGIVASLAVALVLVSSGTPASEPGALVIRGGTVFDATKGTMLPERTILIEGERITAIGTPERPVRIPRGARVIEARGKYIIPGLIDAHVHLVHQLNFAHVTGDEVLPLFLANGVTSVRDAGDEIVAEKLVARYAAAHPELCPRVFLCSPLIDRDPPYHRDIGRGVTDPTVVPALVEDMVAWGVSTLKIYDGTERPVGRKVIEEGHRHGLAVIAHLGRYSLLDAVADGIDGLEHIADGSVFDFLFPPDAPRQPPAEERRKMAPAALQGLLQRVQESRANLDLNNATARALIATLAQRQVMVDPTLVVFRNYVLLMDLPEIYQHPDNSYLPERLRRYYATRRLQANLKAETQELRKREFRKYQELTGILHRAGVPLLAGTDTPEPFTPPGFSLHQELELLVESGLPPAAALQAATLNNARALKRADQLGSIEVGKLADLVILTADPLAEITNTRRIEAVIKGGRVSDPKTLINAVPVQ